ncbi:hypothetical protein HOLleu_39334 [Holothuria leucospilota]|uniref:Tyr recombinase domain-containing protein n=1 Tax=Holothuria leucospilota TaxID=206669 RepID=A0A9Q1BE17_HOLLE|nr:hypothetical protein HOLleu_39334 [Holothuria leucospilota]
MDDDCILDYAEELIPADPNPSPSGEGTSGRNEITDLKAALSHMQSQMQKICDKVFATGQTPTALLSSAEDTDTDCALVSDNGTSEEQNILSALVSDLEFGKTSGPPVHEKVASLLENVSKEKLSQATMKERCQKYDRPNNIESLQPTQVNKLIWDQLKTYTRNRDMKIQRVQFLNMKAMTALTVMLNEILIAKGTMDKETIMTRATDALALLGSANIDLNQVRRDLIKPELKAEYRGLSSNSSQNSVLLFGDDISQQMRDIADVNKISRRLTSTMCRFGGSYNYTRTRGRGRGGRATFGVHEHRPPSTRYKEIWDASLVLNHLRSLHPLRSLSLKQLSYKLVMLLALTTAQRLQTLYLMDLRDLHIEGNRAVFTIKSLVKQQKPGSKPLQCVLHSYPADSRLDVLKVLQHYIDFTKPIREEETKLLVSYVAPHKRVTTDTLARWLKDVMRQSGIDTEKYKAHSTRAAAASLAHLNRVPVTEILNVAGWTSEKTFATFYNKPISKKDTFAETLLSGPVNNE